MTLVYYTYIYLGVLAALRGFDGQLEEAGLSLGTPPLTTAARAGAGAAAGRAGQALVVFTLVVGNFALAMLLGSRVPLLSVMTYAPSSAKWAAAPRAKRHVGGIHRHRGHRAVLPEARGRARVYTMTQGRAPAAAMRVRSWASIFYPAAWVW